MSGVHTPYWEDRAKRAERESRQYHNAANELAIVVDSLRAEIERWKSEQRRAFMAGWEDGLCGGHKDAEQAWQQYRCQDPTDFRTVPTKDTPTLIGVDMGASDGDRTAYRCIHCKRVFDEAPKDHECEDDIAERLEAEFGPFWDKAEYCGIELSAPAATVLRDLGRAGARAIKRMEQALQQIRDEGWNGDECAHTAEKALQAVPEKDTD